MNAPEELAIKLPRLTLAAQAWGAATLPPLLAIHGWLDNAGSYARLAPLLATRFRVIALELPGHGASAHLPPGASYHVDDYVHALLAVTDALGIGGCTLLGHSLGAGVASFAAAAAPGRYARLLLIEGLGLLPDQPEDTLPRWRSALAPVHARRPLRVFADVEQAIATRSTASGLDADLARPIVERALEAVPGGLRWRSDARLTRPSAIRMTEGQSRRLLGGIEAPTALLLARPQTPYLPGAMMEARAACVPHIEISHLDGCHHLHLEHPEGVAAWVFRAADAWARGARR